VAFRLKEPLAFWREWTQSGGKARFSAKSELRSAVQTVSHSRQASETPNGFGSCARRRSFVFHCKTRSNVGNMGIMRGKVIVFVILWLALLETATAQTQLIVNGEFESGSPFPWVLGGTPGAQFGSGYVEMGNANGAVQWLYQTIVLPTNFIGATLSLANETISNDPNDNGALSVWLADNTSSLDFLQQIGTTITSGPNLDSGWDYGSTNFITYQGSNILSTYAGQTVNLLFYVVTDSTYGIDTFFYITDVSLEAYTTANIPANDDFTNATLIPSDGITNVVTTICASRETGEPLIATNKGGHSLWWTWTSPGIGTVTINTAGSDFNTLLGVYTGSTLTNLTVVTNSNGHKLASGVAFVKFNVTKGTQYQISLDGFNGQTGTADFTFIYSIDSTPPKIAITAPKVGERWSNNTFNVTGTAKDNVGVDALWFELNTNGWTTNVYTSNGFANWNTNVTLTPGTNTIKVYAVDAAGNVSATNSVKFYYILTAPFTVQINGLGKISPNYTNVMLQISNNYSITATAGSGYVFSNWVASTGAETSSSDLKFTFASNLSYTVNFVPNPFTASVGTYQGLFYDANEVAQASSGFFSAQVENNGRFTAKFLQGNKSFPISGQFSLTGGWFTNSLKAWDDTAITLQLDLTNGDVLEGSLTNASWTAELGANRAVYSNATPAPQAGKKYTLVLPGTNTATQPNGNGFGSVTVSTGGNVTFSGTLGDGTKVTPSATESGQGQWPFYISLYSGDGVILGWLTFTDEPDRDIDGQLYWFKTAQPSAATYKPGFAYELEVAGSAYSYTKGVPILDLTSGYLLLEEGSVTQNFTPFFLSSNSIVTDSNKMKLTLTTSTGLFQGTTTNAAGANVSFSGAVLQKQTNGFGLYLNGAQTGSVSLAPQ
jgi:hypothetical protein